MFCLLLSCYFNDSTGLLNKKKSDRKILSFLFFIVQSTLVCWQKLSVSGRFSTMLPTRRRTGMTSCRGSMSSWIRSRCFLRVNGTQASASNPQRASRLRWGRSISDVQHKHSEVMSEPSSAPCLSTGEEEAGVHPQWLRLHLWHH